MTASPAQTTPAPLAAYDIAASLALAAGLVAYALIFYTDHTSGDAGALYMAAWLAGNGQGEIVYREAQGAMRPEMSAAQQALGVPRSFPYYYPPLWAHVLAPLAVSVSYETFETVLLVANALAQAAMGLVAWRLFGRAGPLWLWMAATTLLMPVTIFGTSALLQKNPQVIVSLMILLGFERYWAGARAAAAALFAVAAAIKIVPALFALLFIFRRDWRSLGICAAVGAGLLAASFAVAGPAAHAIWQQAVADPQSVVSTARNNLAFQSVANHIGEWLDGNSLYDQRRMPRPQWVVLLEAIVLPVVLAALWWRYRGAPTAAWRRGFVPAFLLVASLAAPLAWTQNFTPVLCLLPALFLILGRNTALALAALVVGANSLYLYADIAKPLREPGIYPVIGFTSLALLALVFAWAGRNAGGPAD